MRHVRPYLPPLLLFLPMALIGCKLLFTPVRMPLTETQQEQTGATGLIDTGWPWVFSSFYEYRNATPPAIDLRYSSWPILAGDLAVMLIPIAIAAWLLLAHYRRHRRWLNISLRGLLVLVTLAAVVVGWWTYNTRAWSRAESAFETLKTCDAERSKPVYCGPEWLRRLIPDEHLASFYYAEQLTVSLHDDDGDPWPLLQREFPKLRYIRDLRVAARPAHAVDWSIFRRLDSLTLAFKGLDDQSIAGIDALTSLQSLHLGKSVAAADSNLADLGQLTTLEAMWLPSGANERNTAFITSLTNLRALHTADAEINDKFLDLLTKLRALEQLDMLHSKITDAGIRRLLDFPNLKEIVLPELMKYTSETARLATQLQKQGAEVRFGRLNKW